ncbi:uncharacterized protein LOC128931458 [Callithrix jacchus]
MRVPEPLLKASYLRVARVRRCLWWPLVRLSPGISATLSAAGPWGGRGTPAPRPDPAPPQSRTLTLECLCTTLTPQGRSLVNEFFTLQTSIPCRGPSHSSPLGSRTPTLSASLPGAAPGSEAHIRPRSLARWVGCWALDASAVPCAAEGPRPRDLSTGKSLQG